MKRIKSLKELKFFIGGCFGDNEKLHIREEFYKAWREEGLYNVHDNASVKELKFEGKENLISSLNELNVLEWERDYWKPVCDGIQWELKLTYNGNLKKYIYGSNHYPDNFNELIKILNQFYPFEEVEFLDWTEPNN